MPINEVISATEEAEVILRKEITDLPSATSVDNDDLLLLRKTNSGSDQKISLATFIKEIGNPAVKGFTAISEIDDKLTLTPANNSIIDVYYNGMEISFISPIVNTGTVQIKIGNLAYKDLLEYDTTSSSELTIGKYIEAVYNLVTDKFYQTNVITSFGDLSSATSFSDGDFLPIRKAGVDFDQKISQTDFVKTIGNPAIIGFTATSNLANKVTLTPANNGIIDAYYNGMQVTFVSPIKSTGLIQINIGNLGYRDLLQYGTTITSELDVNQYIEAIYNSTTNKFYQTNVITPTIYTNEYIATGVISTDQGSTVYTLTSAFGSSKIQYYIGMSLLFTADIESKGTVFVNVDNLGNKPLNDGPNDTIANDLYQGQVLMAIYDGTQFIKNKFSVINNDPIIIPQEDLIDNSPADPPLIPLPDPGDIGDVGNPNDVHSAISAESLDLNGRPFFKEKFTVGSNGNFQDLYSAIEHLKKEFGEAGGGNNYAITILPNYDQSRFQTTVIVGNDLSWISIFSLNNFEVIFTVTERIYCTFQIKCSVSPIFNFKFKRTGTCYSQYNCVFYLDKKYSPSQVNMGANSEITINSINTYDGTNENKGSVLAAGNFLNFNAPCGFKLYSPYPFIHDLVVDTCNINNGSFYHTGTYGFIFGTTRQDAQFNGCPFFNVSLTNCTFFFNNQNAASPIFSFGAIDFCNAWTKGNMILRNVTCTQRSNTMIGIRTKNVNVTLENCNFSGSGTPGHDIVVLGDSSDNKIYLRSTTGTTNQNKNIPTNQGTIIEIT
jgi:hypothetical protein